MKKIAIYIRNKELTPSSYYRIVQYTKGIQGEVLFREIAPKSIYKLKISSSNKSFILRIFINALYYLVMLFRVCYFLLVDNINIPNCVIVSKTFCPRYSPFFLIAFIKRLSIKSELIWDFDDYIFISGEISKRQKKVIEKYSKKIIVTNEYLKQKINPIFQHKVLLMPTTDGDLQGFDSKELLGQRSKKFSSEIRLVWVATSGNIRHLMRILDALDSAADKLFLTSNKQLILTIVCDKPIEYKTRKLVLRNITWTREKAKEEIYNSHIGLMPLINGEYTKGKGGFKLIQYISTGLPVVASNVGFNDEVVDKSCGILVDDYINTDLWIDSIVSLSNDEVRWCEMSRNAYLKWSDKFSFSKNMESWNMIIHNK
ncbi:glycosyltransferase [Metabacillus indicus]|uniref:glycosyltransferase n=1 Tax=Metabacillus indicus TaxID=246786 RepID=UPI002492722A|nr:glycosyltransferase [Metabacillus indicus]